MLCTTWHTDNLVQDKNQSQINLEQVSNDAIVGNLEDRSLGILVDRHNYFTVFHTSEVLNCTRDADGYVQLLHNK